MSQEEDEVGSNTGKAVEVLSDDEVLVLTVSGCSNGVNDYGLYRADCCLKHVKTRSRATSCEADGHCTTQQDLSASGAL